MFVKKYLPGILLSFVIAAVSIFLGGLLPLIGSSVLAIVFGIVLNNSMKLPAAFKEGLSYSGKKLLQYSIIFLGFSMSIGRVSETGISSLRISLITILIAFLAAYLAGRFFKMNRVLTILIGFGTAICGGSAIAAASPILEADEEEIALSISTIFFFNILAVFIFPFLGHLLQMSDAFFGTWAGTAINDTSSVVAAGYTYSSSAGDLATIVKLSRALMIVPACLIFAAYRYIQSKQSAQKTNLKQIFPAVIPYTKFISQWLMAMALAAIGAKVSFKQFKQAGAAPLLTGAFAWFCVAVSSLIIQYFF